MIVRIVRALSAVVLASLLLPGLVNAHPLGNFTINHFARVTVDNSSIAVRWVLDMAEIPAFSEIRAMDTDQDGLPDPSEQAAWLDANLPDLMDGLELNVDGQVVPLRLETRTLAFPSGQGGLSTLRLVVELSARTPPRTGNATFLDATYHGRIGWREIVVQAGSGIRLTAADVPSEDRSDELRRYPPDALNTPLAVSSATFSFIADGSAAEPTSAGSASGAQAKPDDPLAALAGGELTPLSAIMAVLLALGLGALHGISPGHGKALVAGYLIGSRGNLRQAVWLGLTVALSHTIGVVVLGAVTLGATALILPERIIGWLALGSAILVLGLGASLLRGQLRSQHPHPHPHAHPHPHSHGAAPAVPTLSTRAVAALGLVGGMVPSASALLVLLVAVTLHRLVFGVVLVVAFGLGMAMVLAGISASVVLLRGRAARAPGWLQGPAFVRIGRLLPLASAMLVMVIGVALTVGAAANLA